ncbi:hypothetical protein DQ04_17351010 [Trypanosoma grayi]|uniref:hypothetical protein n=1 Tax=Trypanosoma grayi TaxID=71804 RepID=UPI0004F3EF9B|nr:hypothetical protein DQ04_17351010 [Trypanosoma grayi]KEG05916.1 hypothetical protein DQ04_17351010 [Trypanosoma grayi]
MLVQDVKFCFIAANVTIGGRTYTQMQNVSEDSWGDVPEGLSDDDGELTTGLSGGVIAGIAIAGIVLLSVLVAAVVYVLHQRRKNRRESLDSGTRPSPTVPHSVQRQPNPLTTVSADTSPPPTVPPQGDGAAQVPVVEQLGNTVQRHVDPINMQEVRGGNSVPSEEPHEGGATNQTENITAANNNEHYNVIANMLMGQTTPRGSTRAMMEWMERDFSQYFYTALMNQAQGGSGTRPRGVLPQDSRNEE